MISRIFTVFAFYLAAGLFFAGPAMAACNGDSYLDRLDTDQRAQLDRAVSDMPFAKGLLWTARHDDATIAIVGTMHIHDPRLDMIMDRLQDHIADADLVMLEATPAEEAQLAQMFTTDPERFFITDGPTLPERLDEATWQAIADAASDRGIPSFMAAKMQPWYLGLTLAIPACAMPDLMAGKAGLDKMIIDRAEAANVPMQAVEPYTTLFDMFDDGDFAAQLDRLRLNMLAPDLQSQMFVAMLDLYFAEDVGRLWELSRLAVRDMPGMDDTQALDLFAQTEQGLLTQRNRDWIPVITDASQDNDSMLVAVGAAHLLGEQGILQLLQDEGWQITRGLP